MSRSQVAAAVEVTRAKLLLAVARGDDYQTAAHSVGRSSGDAVSHLVARFNAEGLAALPPRHGGGRAALYDHAAARRVLHEAGYSHQRKRSWCPTGTALRRRKAGATVATDLGATPKKS